MSIAEFSASQRTVFGIPHAIAQTLSVRSLSAPSSLFLPGP
ncbi:hypothetical protein [Streptomyces sp. NPDC001315]